MDRLRNMSTGRFAVVGAVAIVIVVLVFITLAVYSYYGTGFSEPELWANPLYVPAAGGAVASTGTPSWTCGSSSQRVLFKDATYSVTDGAGVTHSMDVTAVLNSMRPASGTLRLTSPLSAFSFTFPSGEFTPTPAVVLNAQTDFGSLTPDYDSVATAVATAGSFGAPVWSDGALTSSAANSAGWPTFGAPYSAASANGNILQYGAQDATATLSVRWKCV